MSKLKSSSPAMPFIHSFIIKTKTLKATRVKLPQHEKLNKKIEIEIETKTTEIKEKKKKKRI